MDVYGWHRWQEWPPPSVLIQVHHAMWPASVTIVCFPDQIPKTLTPALKWRLTGIAKQRIEVA